MGGGEEGGKKEVCEGGRGGDKGGRMARVREMGAKQERNRKNREWRKRRMAIGRGGQGV